MRLCGQQFPQWSELPIERVEPFGTDNAIDRLGDGMVVRLPRIEGAVASLLKERRWLPRLAPFLPLAVPVPLAAGRPDDRYPFDWSIYEWLDGETTTRERIRDRGRAAADLAGFIAALQHIDATGGPRPKSDSGRGVQLAKRDAQTRAAIAALGDRLDVGAVTTAWEEALRAPE